MIGRGLATALAVAALVGCHGVKPPIGTRRSVPPQRGGTFQFAIHDDVRGLDPAVVFDVPSSPIVQVVFTPLVDYDKEGHLVPRLAESYEMSADGKRVSFHLRRGALFHDGDEVTADDVKRSMERALDPETPCLVPSFFASIVGYDAFHNGTKRPDGSIVYAPHLDGVVVDGRYALHIDLSDVDAAFLPAMSLHTVAPVCKSAGSKYTREWGAHVCGSGPFRFEDWQPSREIEVVRHDGYFEPGLPYLDRIRYFLLSTYHTQRFKFEQGDLDHIRELTAPDLLAYRKDPRWKALAQWEPAKETSGIFLNTQMKPFDNVELRRAFAAAIDWPRAISVRPEMETAAQMIPPMVLGHDPSFAGQTHDVAAALEHMKNAGFAYDPVTRSGGYPETIVFVGPSETAITENIAPIIQQQVARIGIRLEIRQMNYAAASAEYGQAKRVQLGYGGWSMDFPDPSDFFEPTLSSDAIQEDDSQNYAHYSNPQLDALLKQAHRELDPTTRFELYSACERIVRDDVPWALGFHQRWYEIVQPYVHDYRVDAKHNIDLRDVWIDGAERRIATNRPARAGVLAMVRPWGRR